jgi:hypothetical protein
MRASAPPLGLFSFVHIFPFLFDRTERGVRIDYVNPKGLIGKGATYDVRPVPVISITIGLGWAVRFLRGLGCSIWVSGGGSKAQTYTHEQPIQI